MFVPIRDENRLRSITYQYVTVGLIAINIAVFVGLQLPDLLQSDICGQMVVAKLFGVVPVEIFGTQATLDGCSAPSFAWIPEPLTLISYQFLHGDVLHLLGNMLFLWVFGDNVEDALGHTRFLIFYLACGVLAGLAHAVMLPGSKAPLIGASGAVAGVIGAYLLLHPRVLVWVLAFRFIPLHIPAALVLGVWVVTQIVMVLVTQQDAESVAWWAHLGGCIAGAILVVFMRRPGVKLLDKWMTA